MWIVILCNLCVCALLSFYFIVAACPALPYVADDLRLYEFQKIIDLDSIRAVNLSETIDSAHRNNLSVYIFYAM